MNLYLFIILIIGMRTDARHYKKINIGNDLDEIDKTQSNAINIGDNADEIDTTQSNAINIGDNANEIDTTQSNAGWMDIFNIFNIFQVFNGYSDKCAIYEGYPGTCKAKTFNCPNARNVTGTKNSCVYSMGSFGTCCPSAPWKRTVLPPSMPNCGIRNWPETNNSSNSNNSANQTEPQYLIVGGNEAAPHSWPWLISLMFKSLKTNKFTHICGGTIVNDLYILCAAHCVLSLKSKDFKIKIGASKLKGDGDVYDVEKIIVHEGYSSQRHQNDISLFKLAKRITWKYGIAPVCLPPPEIIKEDLTGQKSWLIGWGTTKFGGKVSQNMQEVEVPILKKNICSDAYNNMFVSNDRISERQLCAGYNEGGKDSCQGDSGGPLLMEMNGRIFQMGIVSYGNGCAKAGFPGVYTYVPWFLYWMGVQMEKDFPYENIKL